MPRRPVVLSSLVVALTLAAAPPVFGQGAGAQAEQPILADAPRAPVVIDGETLFLVRGVTSYPAAQRASDLADRVRAFAANASLSPASLTLDEQAQITWIRAGDQRLAAVLDEDAALEQIDRRTLAQVYLVRIRNAVDAYRQAREPQRLLRSAGVTILATLALLAAGYVGRRIIRRLRAALETRYESRVQGVQIQAFQIVRAKQIWHLLSGVLNLAWVVVVLALLFFYLRGVLDLFPWTRGLGRSLVALVTDPVATMATGIIAEVPSIAFLAVLFVVIRYLLKVIRLFFQAVADNTVKLQEFDSEWAWPTYRLARLFIIALAIVVAYPYVPGSQSDAFKGVSLFIGVVFSLGSSSLIGNIIAGYSMTYRRAFRTGDRVKIGDHIGEVERMRLLVTHLRTPKNEEVIVPNSSILAGEVINYSSRARERGLILHTTVGIGYETPWRQVEAMLIEAAERTPGLWREKAPFVLQKGLGDFAITYEINVYINTPERIPALYTALHRSILDVFNEYGIQIMTPAYEGDPAEPKVVPRDQWYTAPAQRPDAEIGASARAEPGEPVRPSPSRPASAG